MSGNIFSVNQLIKPITTEEKNNLYIGGCESNMELRSILLMKKLLDVFAVNIKKRLRITKI